MFFIVSGGPFGLEGLVGSVGPVLALTLLIATPLVYSVPEALLVGELASMLPLEGGYYQWVKRAFGRFWGFWNGWLSWAYSLLDMALYPVLLLQYLRFFAPGLGQVESWLIACAMIWIATWLNLRGTRVVGGASGVFVALVLAPFAVLTFIATARWLSPEHGASFVRLPLPPGSGSFLGLIGIGLSQAIWNYSGWDNASTLSGEIEDAGSNYPKALTRTLPLVTAVYLVAIVPVLAVTQASDWTDGAWPDLGAGLAGPWLGAWLAAAGMLSAFALFNVLLLAYADPARPRARRPASRSAGPHGCPRRAAQCRSRLGRPLLGLRVDPVRRAPRRGRSPLHRSVGARVRRAVEAAAHRAQPTRHVSRPARNSRARDARGASDSAHRHRGGARDSQPRDRATGRGGRRRARSGGPDLVSREATRLTPTAAA
jgi:hypothetical protein